MVRWLETQTISIPEYSVREKIQLRADETAVIVVDMQNDFVDPKGALFVPKARETIQPIKKLLEKAREKKVKIFYTQDWHEEDDIEFGIWGKHAIAGTWGAEIIEELEPQKGDKLIKKLRYDAFFGTPLDHLLRLYGVKNVVIVGTVANICVLHTAGSAALNGYKVIVPIDGISAINDFDYHAALRQIDFLYKGILTTVEGIEFV